VSLFGISSLSSSPYTRHKEQTKVTHQQDHQAGLMPTIDVQRNHTFRGHLNWFRRCQRCRRSKHDRCVGASARLIMERAGKDFTCCRGECKKYEACGSHSGGTVDRWRVDGHGKWSREGETRSPIIHFPRQDEQQSSDLQHSSNGSMLSAEMLLLRNQSTFIHSFRIIVSALRSVHFC
jgi:hypothetical protein